MSKVDTSLQVWLGNVPAGETPSDVKAQIASHGCGWPHFVKVLKSKHVGVKVMNCIVTMPSAASAFDLLHGHVTWSNGKHAVIRAAFDDKKPKGKESADEAGIRWKRDQLVRQLAQVDAQIDASSSSSGKPGTWYRAEDGLSSSSSGPAVVKSVGTLLKEEIDKLKTNMQIPVAVKTEEVQEESPKICPSMAQPVPHGPDESGIWGSSPLSSPPRKTYRSNPYLLSPDPRITKPAPKAPRKLVRKNARVNWDELSPVSAPSSEFSEH